MTVQDKLIENGYADTQFFMDLSGNSIFDTALIGITGDGRAVYDYSLMIEWLMDTDDMTRIEAQIYIENTVLQFPGEDAPVIMYALE